MGASRLVWRAESSPNQIHLNQSPLQPLPGIHSFRWLMQAPPSRIWVGEGGQECKGQQVGPIHSSCLLLPAPQATPSALQRLQNEQCPPWLAHPPRKVPAFPEEARPKLGPKPSQLSSSRSGTKLLSPGGHNPTFSTQVHGPSCNPGLPTGFQRSWPINGGICPWRG